MNDHQLWTVRLGFKYTLSGNMPEKLSDALEDAAVAVSLHNLESADGDNWTVTLTTLGPPDIDGIFQRIESVKKKLIDKKNIVAEKLPEKDWLLHVHEKFPPLTIGKFFVHGSHHKGVVPKKLIPLKIDAATAFGSGEHETTRGCIEVLCELKKKHSFKNALDMGTGSGILAVALAKLWPSLRITAIDIDPESISVTKRHVKMNGVSKQIKTEAGDGYRSPLVSKNSPYDIVTANILANPLIDMAPDLASVLKPGGYAVLSGLLTRQKKDVVAAHKKNKLDFIYAETIGAWQTLVLQKPE